MNDRLTYLQLIDAVAHRQGMSKKRTEQFIREFFALIQESLIKDSYVRIKGLGTFKLIEVQHRDSVDVHTGNKINIQGHTKIAFTPEGPLKEKINQPFANFETVLLNDESLLENTELAEHEDLEGGTDYVYPEEEAEAVNVDKGQMEEPMVDKPQEEEKEASSTKPEATTTTPVRKIERNGLWSRILSFLKNM